MINTKNRLQLIQKTAYLFLIIGIAMSLPLWLHDRLFPLAPTFGAFPSFGNPVDIILLSLLGLSLVLNLFLHDRRIQITTLVLLGILLLQDQMRWQPWVYVYLLVSLPFIFIPNQTKEKGEYENKWILLSIQVLLIGIYFWSGVNKFNPGFTEVTYQLMLTNLFGFPEGSKPASNEVVGIYYSIYRSSSSYWFVFC